MKKEEQTTPKKTQPGRDERGRFTKGHKIAEETRFQDENAAACKYKEEYADMLIEFFNKPNTTIEYAETLNSKGEVIKRVPVVMPAEYPTFEAFAAKIGVTTDTLLNWCDQSHRFRHYYARAKEMQKAKLIANTLRGFYNPLFAKFEAVNNHDMSDKTNSDTSHTFSVVLSDEINEESD